MVKHRLSTARRVRRWEQEVDPMENVANLFDIMLVFVCGLLIVIIMYWNINLKDAVVVLNSDQLSEVQDAEEILESMGAASDYNDLGTAYLDPETGQMFVVNADGEAVPAGD